MYRRSYDYTTTPEQREEFMKQVNKVVDVFGLYSHSNDYPYDMCRDKKVKVKHLTVFYKDFFYVDDIIKKLIPEGYTVQINSSDNQTIPEINHLHFIKIIDE